MNRTPELNDAANLKAWQKEIAVEIARQLRPELEKQTALLTQLLETQLTTAEGNLDLIVALKKRFGL